MGGSFDDDFSSDFKIVGDGSFNSDFSNDFATVKPLQSIDLLTTNFAFTSDPPVVSTGVLISAEAQNFTFSSNSVIFENRVVNKVRVENFGSFVLSSDTATVLTNVDISVPYTTFVFDPSQAGVYKLRTIKWTGVAAPLEHIEDSKNLDMEPYVDLFQIVLADRSSKVYMKANNTVTWQGDIYEGTGIKIEGVANYSDEEVSRPRLTLYNPDGVYSYLVDQGLLDNAAVIRTRVLKQHIDSDQPIYQRQQWRVSRVASVRKNMLSLELRDLLDGQYFLTPGRMFIPPEFPQVSLQ